MDSIRREALVIAAEESEKLRVGLRDARSPVDFQKLGLRLLRTFDSLFKVKLAESGDKIDCRAGCAICCHLKVDAFPIDIFIMVEYMKQHLKESQLAEIHARAKGNRARIAGMNADEQMHARVPCPFLQDGHCLCYEARPIVCRKHHSSWVGWCEGAFKHPTGDGKRAEVYEITYTLAPVIVATQNVWHEAGFDAKPYDFSSALDEALANPACFRRWRDGKSAFSKECVAKDWEETQRATVPLPHMRISAPDLTSGNRSC
jgi:Fe-S-cluster containining protein